MADWGAMGDRDPDDIDPAPERELEALRERIRRLDLELVERAAERIELARRVGEAKRKRNQPTVDYAQERVVLERARAAARERGLDPAVAADLFAGLIRAAVTAQDEDSLRSSGAGIGQRAVVVGGAGRMGRWVTRFLGAQGFRTHVLDVASPEEANAAARMSPAKRSAATAGSRPRSRAAARARSRTTRSWA